MTTVDVAIIGGGIAGLAAGYELSRRGASFIVLEASTRAGGVIFSEEIDGFTIDAGPDSLLIQKPAAIELCQAIGLGDRLVSTTPPRLAYVLRGGGLHALPAGGVLGIPTTAGPFARTRLFSTAGKLRMAAELFVPRRDSDTDESIGAFMTRRFGREATDYLAEPLLAGIHAGDVDRLSLRSLFPRFVEAEQRYGSLIRAFRHESKRGARAGSGDGAFKSLPGGLSEMTCALVRQLGPAALCLQTAATAIEGDGPFRIATSTGDSIHARAVILATPAFVTASLLRPRDAGLASLCGATPYASVATVALAFRRDAIAHPLNGSGFVVPRKETRDILAGSWLSSKWPHRAPSGFALLRTFIGGARDPEAPNADDRGLVARSMQALRPLLGIEGDPLFARVYRWSRANAQHEVGHAARLASIDSRLERHPGVFLTGSGFRGVGIPDCVADAREVAGRAYEEVQRQNSYLL